MTEDNKESYRKAVKNLSKKEIAESILISNTKPISQIEHEEFLKKRLKLINNRTKEEVSVSNLLQFKYELETYIEIDEFDTNYSFANCLKRYMQIIYKTSKNMVEELRIHKTRLSRILNEREEANSVLVYKLEKHSGQLLPAILWWKLITLKKEHEIITNKKHRKEATQKVKSAIKLRGKVSGL